MSTHSGPAIRPIETHAEFDAVERLQREVWDLPDLGVVPAHLLITAAKNGGLLLGAFDGERLAGFVFGFLGLTPDGRLKHCSHMAGVDPAYRDRGLGQALKLAQREHVLAQGLDLVTWTFDPLEARNANLNFHKLGATCNTYLRNLYGEMSDGLNAGLPSDRFQVDWWVREVQPPSSSPLRGGRAGEAKTVEEVQPPSSSPLRGGRAGEAKTVEKSQGPSRSLVGEGRAGSSASSASPFVVSIRCIIPDLPPPLPLDWPADCYQALVEVPADFQAVKAADMALALQWRLRTRNQFEAAFAAGYQAVDFVHDEGRCWYLLERT